MIQRIQTVYLSVIIVLCVFLASGSFFICTDETGQVIKIMLSGHLTDNSRQTFDHVSPLWPVILMIALTGLGSIITIMLYKIRKVQMIVNLAVMVFSAGLIIMIVLYSLKVNHSYRLVVHHGYKDVAAIAILIFSVLSYLAIRKDDRIVKSYDRLR